MTRSIKHTLRRAMAGTCEHASPETLERVGRSLAAFIEAENNGNADAHPEASIVELPIEDHETARKCFDMLELLRELDDSTS